MTFFLIKSYPKIKTLEEMKKETSPFSLSLFFLFLFLQAWGKSSKTLE